MWTHKGVDLAPQPVVGLMLQLVDAEKFPPALGLEDLDPLPRVGKHGPCSTAKGED